MKKILFCISVFVFALTKCSFSQTVSEITNILNTKPQSVTTAAATVTNDDLIAALDLTTSGYRAVSIQIKGTWTGTVTFQGSNDNFTTTDNILAYSPTAGAWSTSTTSNGTFIIPSLYGKIRVRATTVSSGTINSVAYGFLNNVTFPVSSNASAITGTVTANAGTNLNTSLLALESGGNLATIAGKDFATQTTLSALNTKIPSNLTVTSTRLLVDGSGVTQPISGSLTNISGTVSLPTGASTLSEQQTQTTALQLIDNLPNTLGSTTSGQSGALGLGAVTTAAPSYTTAQSNALSLQTDGSLRTAVTNTVTVSGTVTSSPSGTQSVNIAQVNGNTALAGNGVTGTGSPRMTIASDNTAFPVNPLSATAPVVTMNSASANSGLNSALAAGFDDVAPTAITENSFGFLRMSTNRNLYGTIRDAAGNERGANVNASNQLSVSVDNTVTVASHAVTNAGTFVVQENGSALTALQLIDNLPNTLGSTTSGQSGALALGAVTTAAPSYTTAQTNALSLQTDGSLRVAVTSAPSTTVTATNLSTNIAQVNGVTTSTGSGVMGTGVIRVAIASDNDALTVKQATAANLNATVVGTGTFATQVASATAPVNTMNSASANAGVNSAVAMIFDDVSPTAITENSFGFQRMSANHNAYTTIRDAAGNERGVNVSAGNALLVDASATTQPVSYATTGSGTATGALRVEIANNGTGLISTVSTVTNLSQLGGAAIAMNTGVRSAGTQRVTIATDDVVPASQSGTWTVQPGNTANTTAWLVAGGKTNNAAAPGATNLGALVAIANASAPSWTEGNEVLLSTDLTGALRVSASVSPASDATASQNITSTQSATSGTLNSESSVSVYISGTWTGTVVFEASTDGTNYYAVNAVPITGGTIVTSATANGQWQLNAGGYANVRVRGNTVATGTAVVAVRISQGSGLFTLATPIPTGSNVIGAVTQSGTWNVGTVTTLTGITNVVHVDDNSGSLTVDNGGTFAVQASSSTAPVNTMNSASANSGINAAAAFVFDDVSPTSITENSFGFGRMSANHNQYVTLRDAAGNERGLNIDANNAIAATVTNATAANLKMDLSGSAANTTAGLISVKFDQTTVGTTNAVSIAQIGATTVVNGGTAGSLSVGGMVANNGTINSAVNPILIGGQAVSSENAANTTAKLSQLVTDLVGKLIVLPYANPENFVSGTTTAMTGTTSTSVVAAPAGSLRNYITTIIVTNSHATVGTDVQIRDGSAGTILMTIPAGAVYGGAVINLPVPLKQTAATALFAQNVTTGASTIVTAVGYKGL